MEKIPTIRLQPIDPTDIACLCANAKSIKANTEGFAAIPIVANARYRIEFEDHIAYVVISESTRKLFFRKKYYGALVAYVRKDEEVYNARVCCYYLSGTEMTIGDRTKNRYVSVNGTGSDIYGSATQDLIVKLQYDCKYKKLSEDKRREGWTKYTSDHPKLRIEDDALLL